MGLAVVAGLALRLWAIGRFPVNADEDVVGLMAVHILHGHFSAFYWGQNYGGVEPYAVAAVFAVLGASTFSMGLTVVLLSAVSGVLVWRIGRRMFSPVVGVGAALLFWLWPLVDVWRSTVTEGFRQSALLLGLLLFLFTQRILDDAARSRRARVGEWAVVGFATGMGWWATPEIGYFVVPVALVVGVGLLRGALRIRPTEFVTLLGAFAVGALPWLWANVRSHLGSLRGTGAGAHPLAHLKVFVLHVVPLSLGLQVPLSGRWVIGQPVGAALACLAVVGGSIWLVVLARCGRAPLLVLFVVLFPGLYALSPFTEFWQDGRYALFLSPVLALVAVSGVDAAVRALARNGWPATRHRSATGPGQQPPRPRAAGVAVGVAVAAGLALTLAGARLFPPFATGDLGPLSSATATSWHTDADGGYATLASDIERLGVHDIYAGYWTAYVLDFESHESLVATDFVFDRFPPYAARIAAARRVGWLFYDPVGASAHELAYSTLSPGCSIPGQRCVVPGDLEHWLTVHGVGYRVDRLDGFVLVLPTSPVSGPLVYADLHPGGGVSAS